MTAQATHPRLSLLIIASYFVYCWASIASAQLPAPVLDRAAPIERELKKNESHQYRIKLNAGEFMHAVLVPSGIGVTVRIYGTGGAVEQTYVDTGGEQRIFFVAPETREYRLQVAAHSNVTPGHYSLKIVALRPASDVDRERYLAHQSLASIWQSGLIEDGTAQTRRDAIEKCEKALEVWRKLGDLAGEADAHFVIGTINSATDPTKAMADFEEALLIARSIGDRWREESILERVGEVYSGLGDMYQSIAVNGQSLALARELGDQNGERLNLYEIALSYKNLGDAQQSLDYNYQLLKISGSDDADRILALHSLCQNFLLLGEPRQALEYCGRALPVWQATGRRLFEAATLSYMGQAYALQDDSEKELDYYQRALALFRESENKLGAGSMLRSIGHWYQMRGEHQRALEYHNQALGLFQAISNLQQETITLRLIGDTYRSFGDGAQALDYFKRALLLVRSGRDQSNEAATLLSIARLERDRGQLAEARKEIEAALAILEALSGRVTRLDRRASYLGTKREYYEFYIDLLMNLEAQQPNNGFAARAFQVSEQARARGLMESLAEARVDLHRGVDAALIAREATIKEQLNVSSIRLTQLLARQHRPEEAVAARDEIDGLLESYAEIETEIRIKNPRSAGLRQPTALNLSEVQSKLLDQDTVLLEYSLGEKRSFVWTITPTSVKSFELPPRAIIEGPARQLYRMLTARSEVIPNETVAQRQVRIERADSEYPPAAQELSRMLLGPVASELGKKRLLIVAEGALQYLPFSALPTPSGAGGQMNDESLQLGSRIRRPLVLDHELISLPSISVLAALRQETGERQRAPRTVAVLADPVFSPDDPRSVAAQDRNRKRHANTVSQIPNDVMRSAEESGLKDFVRLRFSRAEADAITQLSPANERLEAVDFLANRATATSSELSNYRIVHFATHGLMNSQHPELSGVVLSLVDQQGQPQNGFLRLYEIYNLKLNADLVVLSACQTALGKEIKGEGLIGLTRGFMYAGAPRVVASLWRIDDRATAELMSRFYRGMIKDNLTPAAALRVAQISMLQQTRWAAPPYWAAFTIQGEWK